MFETRASEKSGIAKTDPSVVTLGGLHQISTKKSEKIFFFCYVNIATKSSPNVACYCILQLTYFMKINFETKILPTITNYNYNYKLQLHMDTMLSKN
jgi:hypothetical protein